MKQSLGRKAGSMEDIHMMQPWQGRQKEQDEVLMPDNLSASDTLRVENSICSYISEKAMNPCSKQ